MECPICKKDFDEYTGRRPKKFCSDECKVRFWNAKKLSEKNNQPKNKKKIEEERSTPNEAAGKHAESQPYFETATVYPVAIRSKTFDELLTDAKNGNLDKAELQNAKLSSNQKSLILRKQKA